MNGKKLAQISLGPVIALLAIVAMAAFAQLPIAGADAAEAPSEVAVAEANQPEEVVVAAEVDPDTFQAKVESTDFTSTQEGMLQQAIEIQISSDIPFDVTDPSDLQEAAVFAWQEFIALTWPAKEQGQMGPDGKLLFPRDQAQTEGSYGTYGSAGPSGHVVWETFRHRVEVFPGTGDPNGYTDSSASDYGYDSMPEYIYATGPITPHTGIRSVNPFPPFNNLDEVTQISLNAMYAGAVDPQKFGQNLQTDQKEKILYEAKVNRVLYNYVAENKLFESDTSRVALLKFNTTQYLMTGDADKHPPPYIDLPASDPANQKVGSIEIKAAWRRLTESEANSNRFYTARRVRYYVKEDGEEIRYVDSDQAGETWGLIALHIIHKTEKAPTFVFATFEHIDNILDAKGNSVEEPDGTTKAEYMTQEPFSPALKIVPSSNEAPYYQGAIKQAGQANTNSPQLYYHNVISKPVIYKEGTMQPKECNDEFDESDYYIGPVNVNRRLNPIPPTITAVNSEAQKAIRDHNPDAVWQNYRLVNVQARPLDLERDSDIIAEEKPTYYLANSVVETNVALQYFSGGLLNFTDKPCAGSRTDYSLQDGSPIHNMYVTSDNDVTAYNMGGCMGCHGAQGQQIGGDFSVLVGRGRQVANKPDTVEEDETDAAAMSALTNKYLGQSPESPLISSVGFPSQIPAEGSDVAGVVRYQDPDGDLNRVTFDVVSATEFSPFEFHPLDFLIEGNATSGAFEFYVYCDVAQQVTLRVTLFDASGNRSDPVNFSFDCE